MRSLAAIVITFFTLGLASCAATRPAETPVVLRLAPRVGRVQQPLPIVVAAVQARGLSGDRRYTYIDRAKGAELQQARTLFWEEPPSLVVERALNGALGAPLLPTGRGGSAERRLVARLSEFEERTGGAEGAEAVVALEAEVLSPNDRRVIGAGRYCARSPIAGSAPSDRAQAFERAILQVVEAVAQDAAAGRSGAADCRG